MQNHVLRFALHTLPRTIAARLMISAANRSIRPVVSAAEQAALEGSFEFSYGETPNRVARSWGTGPLVLLVHGWGGRAEQMAPLAKALADLGHRAVAINVTGHGNSAGTATAWSYFVDDLAALARELKVPLKAIVGHSAGGLAAMVAQWHGLIEAERYVCIASPSYPYPPLEGVARRLDPPAELLRRYRAYLASELRAEWSRLEACEAFAGLGDRLMLIYDEKDRFVSHTQADRIAAVCTGARVHKTSAHGHTRLLVAAEVRDEVCKFTSEAV
ncbi:alpha/beta fold hydrolase [Variovorax paradoxus]|uniref:alpha/beta fold hydrolase n=1 Tax=Variovorax paradoxus TaxID=34073 RepID=UPI003D656905